MDGGGGGHGDGGEFGGKAEARIVGSGDGDFAAVCAEDVARDGEAEAGVEGIRLEKGIEEVGEVRGGDEGTSMIDDKFDTAIGARLGAEIDGIAGGGMVDGMGQDLGESGAGFRFVHESVEFTGSGKGQRNVAGGRGLRGRGGNGTEGSG